MTVTRSQVENALAENDGMLRLNPAWVARKWMKPGRRLGLAEQEYEVGERGWICERWLGSTTPAANQVSVEGEGISTVRTGDEELPLDQVVAAAPDLVMGEEYARTHDGLGRLAKIFDYGLRVPFHIHPPRAEAERAGVHSKDEAYYYLPGADLGAHPESFFGVHPSLTPHQAGDALVAHLERWSDDRILELSKAYHLYPEGGYFVPSGALHAPGTALTLELQEDSDAMAFLQASCGDVSLSKDLLYMAVAPGEREARGERAILDWIDWDMNLDPDFHSRYAIAPKPLLTEDGVEDAWIFWGSDKFVGKRLRLQPGASATIVEPGIYSLFLWTGAGTIGGLEVRAGTPGQDELLVAHHRAISGVEYVNTGDTPLELIRFFGPDLHPDAPRVR
jgi:hypothetical protein